MNPQRVIEPQRGERRRVISLATRTPAADERRWADRETARGASRDWIAWLCLGLGILCGIGALYYMMDAISVSR